MMASSLTRRLAAAAVLASAAATASCSGAPTTAGNAHTQAPAGATLRIINGTCSGGRCDSLNVLGFPTDGPLTPGGLWSLALANSNAAEICVALPAWANFYVHSPTSTDTTTWTQQTGLALGTLSAPEFRLMAQPSTSAFVPAAAGGWVVTLPGTAAPAPAPACAP